MQEQYEKKEKLYIQQITNLSNHKHSTENGVAKLQEELQKQTEKKLKETEDSMEHTFITQQFNC